MGSVRKLNESFVSKDQHAISVFSDNQQLQLSQEENERQDNIKNIGKFENKVIFNVSDTHYPVVKYVGEKILKFNLTYDSKTEWDIFWTDSAVRSETLAKMQPYQKINHFPGMYCLARKNHLAKNLMRMKKIFPENFNFFPQTHLVPAEYDEFKKQFLDKNNVKTFIVKPEASCQGKGIFLTTNYESLRPEGHYVVQRYLQKPFLIEGLKFDLRIYVLLAGCDPLRIYLYKDGLARFATEKYICPSADNMGNMCMHLTNYAINKDNPNFIFNESCTNNNIGHKRSLIAVFKTLEDQGHDVNKLWCEIKKIIIKTLCSVQPILAHSYKSSQPDDPYNQMCFEILGFDIILDHKLKPWLLEVNHTPSFTTDTPLDKNIKQNVIKDALVLMNISSCNRIDYKDKKKTEIQQRVFTGQTHRLSREERKLVRIKAQNERDEWESNHLGGYEKIFPLKEFSDGEEDYGEFIRVSHLLWAGVNGTPIMKEVQKKKEVKGASIKSGLNILSETESKFGQISRGDKVKASLKRKLDGSKKRISICQKVNANEEATLNKTNIIFTEPLWNNPKLKRIKIDTLDETMNLNMKQNIEEGKQNAREMSSLAKDDTKKRNLLESENHNSEETSSITTDSNQNELEDPLQDKNSIQKNKKFLRCKTPLTNAGQNGYYSESLAFSRSAGKQRPKTQSNERKKISDLQNKFISPLSKDVPYFLNRKSGRILRESFRSGAQVSQKNLINSMIEISDGQRELEEQMNIHSTIDIHKKIKSLVSVESSKPRGYSAQKNSNKLEILFQTSQPKYCVGNYLAPKIFELNIQPPNNNYLKRKHFLPKNKPISNDIEQKELNEPSNKINCSQEPSADYHRPFLSLEPKRRNKVKKELSIKQF